MVMPFFNLLPITENKKKNHYFKKTKNKKHTSFPSPILHKKITVWSTRYSNREWELSFHLREWEREFVLDCCHLSANVVVSSCFDKDLRLRLISMPSLGSRPLFLFSTGLSLGLDEGGWLYVKCVWVSKIQRVCVVEVECPPGVCFGLVMRSWVVRCTPIPYTPTHWAWLAITRGITRRRTIFSQIEVAIVQQSLALVWKENKCFSER